MAEIILPPEETEETPQVPELNIDKPSGNSKVITIEFEAKKTNKVSTKDTKQQLYTTDTDAWFEFREISLEGANGTYSVVFRNRHDGSIFQRTGDVVNGVAYYKIPHQEIRHAGAWRGQIVYTLSNGDTTSREFGYDVKGHILDGKDVREIVVEDFETLMSQLRSMKDNAELELADLANTAEQNETNRQAFFDDLVEDIDELQANYQELLDTGVLQTNINTKLEQLEEEYAPKLTEVTAQLAQTAKQTYSKSTVSGDNVRPMISFYLDDGYQNDYTIVLPKAQQLGIPFTTCLHDDSWVTRNTHALNEMLNAGWEVHAHTTDDQDLREATLEEKRETMRKNKELLEEVTGQRVTGICYPRGLSDAEVLRVAREFFEVGMGSSAFSGNHYNTIPIDTYDVQRIHAVQDNLGIIKQDIDEMIAKGEGWIVIYGHSNQYPSTSSETLFELMEYAKLKNVDTVTVRDAMKVYGNRLDIGDWRWTDNYFKVGSTGAIDSNHMPIVMGKFDSETINDKLGTDFPSEKITIDLVSAPSNIPVGVGSGTLYTDRLSTEKEIVGARAKQRYEDSRGVVATREFLTGEWTDWTTIGGTNLIKTKPYTVDSPLTDFPNGKITNVGFTQNGFGTVETEGGTGSLIVNRTADSNALHYQMFLPHDNNRVYKRTWNNGMNDWNNWEIHAPIKNEVTINHGFGSVNADSIKEIEFGVEGALTNDFIDFTIHGGFGVAGVIPTAHVSGANKVTVRLHNVTTNSISVGTRNISFRLS